MALSSFLSSHSSIHWIFWVTFTFVYTRFAVFFDFHHHPSIRNEVFENVYIIPTSIYPDQLNIY